MTSIRALIHSPSTPITLGVLLPLSFLLNLPLFLFSFFCPALRYLLQNCQITLACFTLHACGKNSREPRRDSRAPIPSLHSTRLKYRHYFIHDESTEANIAPVKATESHTSNNAEEMRMTQAYDCISSNPCSFLSRSMIFNTETQY